MLRKFTLIGLVVLILAGGAYGCSGPADQEEQTPNPPVRLHAVKRMDVERTLPAVATLRSNRYLELRSKLTERVVEFAVDEGQRVQEGDLIVRLNDDAAKNRIQAAEGALAEARSELQNARRNFERQKRLRQQKLVSERDFERAQTRVKSLEGRLKRLRSELDQAKNDLEETKLRAPFSGYVGEQMVDRGQLVTAGQGIIELLDVDPLEVQFSVPGHYSERVQTGQRLRLNAGSGTTLTGEVTYVSPNINVSTRTLLLKGYLENPDHSKRPGEFGRLELITGVLEDALVVPEQSLIAVRDGYIVFVVGPDNTARRRSVEAGMRFDGRVVIESGLSEGDRIIREGHQRVGDGTKVRPVESE